MKKLNKKAVIMPVDNIAEQNAPLAGYAVYILAAAVVASIVYITASIANGGCTCKCTCATSKASMLAAAGYGNHAVSLAR